MVSSLVRRKVLHYVIKSGINVLNLEGYMIPIRFGLCNDVRITRKSLISGSSSYVKSFISDVKKIRNSLDNKKHTDCYYYIQEFPIVIEDRKLWCDILDRLGETRDSDSRSTSYFMLDFYFPLLNQAVEIDSSFHDDREIYDKARDMYCDMMFGIKTWRSRNYGESEKGTSDFRALFYSEVKNRSGSLGWNKMTRVVDFSDTLIDSFISSRVSEFECIEAIIDYVGYTRIWENTEIKITKRELGRICFKHFRKSGKYCENLKLLENISTLMLDIFEINLRTV